MKHCSNLVYNSHTELEVKRWTYPTDSKSPVIDPHFLKRILQRCHSDLIELDTAPTRNEVNQLTRLHLYFTIDIQFNSPSNIYDFTMES